MKTVTGKVGGRRKGTMVAWIDLRILLVISGFAAALVAYAQAPSWWGGRGVLKPGIDIAADYAVANQGQLKNMAKAARDELVAKGHFSLAQTNAINTMVTAWETTTSATDYAPVNLGQLKAVAVPFYDKLQLPYPWATPTTPGTTDYAVANLGQLKNVFAFEINVSVTDDEDGDGISDGWEVANFGSLTRDMGLDADGDGVSDYDEWVAGTDPRDWRSHPGSSNEATVSLSIYTSMVQ